MRIISMHKVDAAMEAGALPSAELIKGMGQLMGELRRKNALVDGNGLRPSATRARVRTAKGERTIQRGPYAGESELVAGMHLVKVKELDEAIDWAARFGSAVGDAEIEVGPITEGWDLGLMAKPAQAPLRCLMLHKADAASEAGQPLPPAALALQDQMKQAGVLLASARLKPSRGSVRVKYANGRSTVLDGPFTESKELIAGYVVLDVASMDEAIEFGGKFASIVGDTELDIRLIESFE
jgi:hypothetical protein